MFTQNRASGDYSAGESIINAKIGVLAHGLGKSQGKLQGVILNFIEQGVNNLCFDPTKRDKLFQLICQTCSLVEDYHDSHGDSSKGKNDDSDLQMCSYFEHCLEKYFRHQRLLFFRKIHL